ncbi:unnamed protein product, partial [Prorocentrum cordatum]
GIVLDIDGTLIDSRCRRELHAGLPEPLHVDSDGDCIFPRPHLEAFLDFCFERFDGVGIWTASSARWAATVVEHALGGRARPWAFVWSSSRCTGRYYHYGDELRLVQVKPLRKLWRRARHRQRGFCRRSTVIVEDTPLNCTMNRGNVVCVPAFNVEAGADDALWRAMQLLAEAVLPAADVRRALAAHQGEGWLRPGGAPPSSGDSSCAAGEPCGACAGTGLLLQGPCPLCR